MRSDGGKANRQSLAAEYQRSSGPSSLRATGFLLHNSLNLFSNFTYFLDDPEHGDQFEQAERRVAAGGRVTYRRLGHFFERHTESAIGVQLRSDWLDPVGLYRTRGPAATVDDARGRSRPDDGGGLCAERDRVDAHLSHDVWPSRRPVSIRCDLGQPAELRGWCRRPGESEIRRHLRTVERNRGLRRTPAPAFTATTRVAR